MTFSLRTAMVSVTAAVALFASSQALAAGTVTITQANSIGLLGDYILTAPDGTQIASYDQATRTLDPAQTGIYTLRITPPTDARLLVTISRNGVEQAATASRDVTFTHDDTDTLLVTISYRYEGVITVDSEPQGASFELLGPNDLRDAGITPTTYTNMAPGAYRVTFHKRSGCFLVAPMQRSLNANQTLNFFGNFSCGVTLPPAPAPAPLEQPVPDVNAGRSLRVWAAANQAEVLPGGETRVTLTVRNTGTRTVQNIVLSAQMDPALLKIESPLPHFGMLVDDLAVWTIPQLYAGKTWSVTLPLTVNKTLKQGDTVVVTARVTGDDLEQGSADALLATTAIGVTLLPQTGDRFDILFAIASLLAAALLAKQTTRAMAKERD